MNMCIRRPKIYSTLTPKSPNSEIYRKGESIRGHRYVRIKTSAGCDSGTQTQFCNNLGGGMRRELGGTFKRKGTGVYLWLIHVDVWQKPTQFWKAIILQFKNKF